MLKIRPSTDEDVPRITEIYSYYVRETTTSLEFTPPTVDEIHTRRIGILSRNMPYLVVTYDESIVGFAYCDWFKLREGYRFTAETTIYLDKDYRGRAIGRSLLSALIDEARQRGLRKLIACIGDSNNQQSIHLHRSFGYHHIGTIKSGGEKFNQWLDVIFMEKNLVEID